jgi:hypothetical protein
VAKISRGFDDLALDNLLIALQIFSAEQELEEAGIGFNVARDHISPIESRMFPFVNLYSPSTDTASKGSKLYSQDITTFYADLYTRGDDSIIDDSVAMSRLYYLKEQVKYGLFKLINADLNFPMGTISSKEWPSWQFFNPKEDEIETPVVAGRWIFKLGNDWKAEDIEGVPLNQIQVSVTKETASLWAAKYTYGGS